MIFTKGIQGSVAWLYLPAKFSDLRAKICVGNRTSHSVGSVKMVSKKTNEFCQVLCNVGLYNSFDKFAHQQRSGNRDFFIDQCRRKFEVCILENIWYEYLLHLKPKTTKTSYPQKLHYFLLFEGLILAIGRVVDLPQIIGKVQGFEGYICQK